MVDFLEFYRGHDTCVIAFASGGEDFRHATPGFEWKRTLDALPVDYILMRDSTERWYTQGVEGIGGREAVAVWINERMKPYERRVGLGLSSGAYAALMFGQLSYLDEVIAISPLTILGPDAEQYFKDWVIRVRVPPNHPVVDLRPYFLAGVIPRVRCFVSDGDGAELDKGMCELLGLPEITMMPGHSHAGLAKHMVENGAVARMITGDE